MSNIRIFSYLPNPRVWKSMITAKLGGLDLEVVGDKPNNMPNWLWDFEARPISEDDKDNLKSYERISKRGFKGSLYKTDEFINQHPFGTVPAGFVGDEHLGVFESNSILRAVARECKDKTLYGGEDINLKSRIDSYLDANLVFSREFQVNLLELEDITKYTYERTKSAYQFYMDGQPYVSEILRRQGVPQDLANNPINLKGDDLTQGIKSVFDVTFWTVLVINLEQSSISFK